MCVWEGGGGGGLPGSGRGGSPLAGQGVDGNAVRLQQPVHGGGLHVGEHQLHPMALQLRPQRAERLSGRSIQPMHQPVKNPQRLRGNNDRSEEW